MTHDVFWGPRYSVLFSHTAVQPKSRAVASCWLLERMQAQDTGPVVSFFSPGSDIHL